VRTLLRAAADLRARRTPFVLATVVRVQGSSYRPPGARMIAADGQWIAGAVSGGCLERDLVQKGWWRTSDGPRIVTYDSTDDDDRAAVALGCGGVVDVLVERAGVGGAVDPLLFIARCHDEGEPGAIATVIRAAGPAAAIGARVCVRRSVNHEASGLDAGAESLLVGACRDALARDRRDQAPRVWESAAFDALVEVILPPPSLFVFGAGRDVAPVVEIARIVGFRVVVVTPDASSRAHDALGGPDDVVPFADASLAARIDAADLALSVVMGHHTERDREALGVLLASRARYIGVLGPRRRTLRLLDDLGAAAAVSDPRLRAPVGLAVGAESPQEIALAIVAEAQTVVAESRWPRRPASPPPY